MEEWQVWWDTQRTPSAQSSMAKVRRDSFHSFFPQLCQVLGLLTCAAVKGELCGGVELLNQELGQRYPLICFKGIVPILPVEHKVIFSVGIYGSRANSG